jgi:hypothetical protein
VPLTLRYTELDLPQLQKKFSHVDLLSQVNFFSKRKKNCSWKKKFVKQTERDLQVQEKGLFQTFTQNSESCQLSPAWRCTNCHVATLQREQKIDKGDTTLNKQVLYNFIN